MGVGRNIKDPILVRISEGSWDIPLSPIGRNDSLRVNYASTPVRAQPKRVFLARYLLLTIDQEDMQANVSAPRPDRSRATNTPESRCARGPA
jgi:hypothetical protein